MISVHMKILSTLLPVLRTIGPAIASGYDEIWARSQVSGPKLSICTIIARLLLPYRAADILKPRDACDGLIPIMLYAD